VRLLIVKTTEIDGLAERNPAKARELIPRILQEIVAGITKLERLGFEEVVVATDHGFVLLHARRRATPCPSLRVIGSRSRTARCSEQARPHREPCFFRKSRSGFAATSRPTQFRAASRRSAHGSVLSRGSVAPGMRDSYAALTANEGSRERRRQIELSRCPQEFEKLLRALTIEVVR